MMLLGANSAVLSCLVPQFMANSQFTLQLFSVFRASQNGATFISGHVFVQHLDLSVILAGLPEAFLSATVWVENVASQG